MTRQWRRRAVVMLAVVASGVAVTTPASAGGRHHDDPIKVVASGLNGPFGLGASGRYVYVAETGIDGGPAQVSRVNVRTGATDVVVSGLPGPADVEPVGNKLAIVTGGSEDPTQTVEGAASLFVARRDGSTRLVADLTAYELANNPDGQTQFDPTTGAPLDSLSNPFSVIADRRGFVLVADAGANDVLRVSRSGEVSTFFAPPVITTGVCENAPNNDAVHAGCDPVPTGLAYGPHNTLYVSALASEVPGEGRVYILNARTGEQIGEITGLTAPTGVAVARDGTVYVSEVLFNAPPDDQPPPPDLDPATVGRIVRIAPDGTQTAAPVTMPVGLVFNNGKLYSSAWAIAGFLGLADAGQVVSVSNRAFTNQV